MADMTRKVILEILAKNRAAGELAAFRGGLEGTGRAVKRLAGSMMAMAGVGGGMYMIGSVLRSSRTEFADFEKGLAKVSTQLDEHTMHFMPTYRAELMRMSADYGAAKTALTEGLFDVLSASIGPGKALSVLETNLRSAKGGFTDTAIATKAAVRVMKAYGYEADQMVRIHDIMHGTVKQGIMTFEEYAGAIGDVLGTAAFLKVDFEAVGASMASMTRSGLDASKSVVALKNIFNQFQYPTQAARDVAAELGFALDETSISGGGLITIIEKLSDANARQLKVLMPSMRGMAGFAGQLKNAAGLARGYAENLESAGRMQTNFAKAAATDSFRVEQATEKWSNFKILLGEVTSPIYTAGISSLTDVFEENRSAIRRWASDTVEGAGMVKKVLPIYWLYAGLKMKGLRAELAEAEKFRFSGGGGGRFGGYGAGGGWEEPGDEAAKQTGAGGAEVAAVIARTNAEILADTREKLASIRSMHDKTRMEKIRMLEDYRMAHFGITSEIEASEKLLNDEMLSLQQSRVNAMDVYYAELREDMQNTSLYTSEKFAEAGRAIEGSMSGAFESMISGGASWRDAMNQFFTDVGNSFAKMAADMAARAAMTGIMDIVMGGRGGSMITAGGSAAGGGNPYFLHGGGIAGVHGTRKPVPFGTFANAPRFHLGSDEVPAILQRGERVIPKGGGAGSFDVHIHNEGSEKMEISSVESYMVSDQRIIDVSMRAAAGNGPYRRSHKQLR